MWLLIMKNNINYHTTGGLATLLLIFLTTSVLAQQTVDFPSGFISASSPVSIFDETDTTITLAYFESLDGSTPNSSMGIRYNKSDLSPIDTLILWTKPGYPIQGASYAFFKQNGMFKYYMSYSRDLQDVSHIDIFNTDDNFNVGNLLFSFEKSNYVLNSALFHKDLFYILLKKRTPLDSIYLYVLDTSGSVVNEQFYTFYDSTKNQIPCVDYINMLIHPVNDSLLVLPTAGGSNNSVYLVDRYSLDTAKSLELTTIYFFNRGYVTQFPATFATAKNYFQYSGTISKLVYDGGLPVGSDLQYYFFRRSWNNDSLELRDFGPPDSDSRSYAFCQGPEHDTKLIAGSVPFDDFRIHGQEYREVRIYRWNDFGTDSISLFGHKNHVPLAMTADKSGDLYVVGTYNDAWTTDSSYVFLTKIPGFALSTENPEIANTSFYLYPNPTYDFIYLDDLPADITRIKVFSASGSLIDQMVLSDQEKIDISGLKAGLYVFAIELTGGDHFSTVIIKQ